MPALQSYALLLFFLTRFMGLFIDIDAAGGISFIAA
jgi:hypothetical protein